MLSELQQNYILPGSVEVQAMLDLVTGFSANPTPSTHPTTTHPSRKVIFTALAEVIGTLDLGMKPRYKLASK